VLEQLVLARLMADPEPVVEAHRARLHEQREALVAAVTQQLPTWHFRRPGGGLALWCELPDALATPLVAEAERLGVILAGGPVFAVEGGLGRFVRLPWTRPVEELEEAVRRVAQAWDLVRDRRPDGSSTTARVMVA
jgi:DNA-binding transcriptional MocR family regulator